MGDHHVGLQARLMSQALRKLTASLASGPVASNSSGRKHKATIVFINQLRQKIGVVYGNDQVTSGGHALKYYASVRMEVKRAIPKGAMTAGHTGGAEGSGMPVRVGPCQLRIWLNILSFRGNF